LNRVASFEPWRIRKLGERTRVAFADTAADWLEDRSSGKKTYEGDKVRLATLLPHLPARLDELTTSRLWHDLRHMWATWHAQGASPSLTLQKLGGWHDPRMVWHYTHLAGTDLLSHAKTVRVPPIVRVDRTKNCTNGSGIGTGRNAGY